MEYQELNKKLAEWLGWRIYQVLPTGFIRWMTPQGKVDGSKPDNFPESLDACDKWLVPKLDDIGEHYIIFQRAIWDKPIPKSVTISFVSGNDRDLEGQGETYALALCLAIEKLIDKEDE